MDLKLFEDLIALARTQSFVRAAELRHVTHPAFGRRIRALEIWAGAPLVERNRTPVQLTTEGEVLLKTAERTLEGVALARSLVQHRSNLQGTVRVGAGRTLATTALPSWLARLAARPGGALDGDAQVNIVTGSGSDLIAQLEQGKIDMLCRYDHRSLTLTLNGHRYRYLTLSHEKLVPVTACDTSGPCYRLGSASKPLPLISYSMGLSLERLVSDHFERVAQPHGVRAFIRTDSARTIYELVKQGLGIGWLPWSMVAAECSLGTMAVLGGAELEVPFEVRLYRPRARQTDVVEALWAATESR